MKRLLFKIYIFLLMAAGCSEPALNNAFFEEELIDIASYLEENKEKYSKLYAISQLAGLKDPLSAYNPSGNGYTLFLPTDEAFDRYIQNNPNYNSFQELLDDKDFVRILGRYHIVTSAIETNAFPYGALPDTTATGDLLTIGFSSNFDSIIYKVNNRAAVIEGNLEMVNGYIHVIGEVLQPVNFSGYEWLVQNPGFSILAKAMEVTGINDTLGIFRKNELGQVVPNRYTILAEHDSIYNRAGIHSIEDLINKIATPGLELKDPDNALYQFAAYHILEGELFLVDFDLSGNYNTLANSPLRIKAGLEIYINQGVDTFRLDISGTGDTTVIDYISLYYQESNILTKNGAIHSISELLEYYIPSNSARTFNFYEEPIINDLRNSPGTYYFDKKDQDKFEVLQWTGPEFLLYYKSSNTTEPAFNADYLQLDGNFTIQYTIPRLLPGKYRVYLRADGYNRANEHATIIVYIDGKRMGNTYNLNSGGQSASDPYKINNNNNGYDLGLIEFNKYIYHHITIETLIPGIFRWDNIRFVPE